MVNIRLQRYGIFLNNQTFLGLFSKLNWIMGSVPMTTQISTKKIRHDHFEKQ